MIESETAESFDARTRAYLLLKAHGQSVCKRTKPKCGECPMRDTCRYASTHSIHGLA